MDYNEEENKKAAIMTEKKRRNNALKAAASILRDCCKDCTRGDISTNAGHRLCGSEYCSIFDALQKRPIDKVIHDSDFVIAQGVKADNVGVLNGSRRSVGRPRINFLEVDRIKL